MAVETVKNRIQLGGFIVDTNRNVITSGDDEVAVQAKVMDVLLVLLAHPGETVTKETLIEQVWQGNEYVGKQGVTRSISILRSIFKDSSTTPRFIETIPRRGYRLLMAPAPVESEPKSHRVTLTVGVIAALIAFSAIALGLFNSKQPSEQNVKTTSIQFVSMLSGSESAPSISPTGNLAFNHESNGNHKIIVTRDWADSSDALELLKSKSPFSPFWSPSGTQLAISSHEQQCKILIFDDNLLHNHTLNCLANTQNVISWMTDSTLLYINSDGVFSSYSLQDEDSVIPRTDLIRALNLLPSHPTYLVHNKHNQNTAVFVPIDMQNHRLIVIAKNGTLMSGPELFEAAKGLSWLDDDTLLVSSRVRGRFELSTVSIKTWQQTSFQITSGYEARSPSSCSGCKHLAMERFSLGSRLTQIHFDNTETKNVTKLHGSRYERFPAHHPQAGLLFVMNDGQSDALYVIQPDTTDPIKININRNLRIIYPSWSNSGSTIAFLGGDDTGTNVYSVSLSNSAIKKHTSRGTFGPPKFSPDDEVIYSGKLNEDNQWYLHLIERDSGKIERLPVSATMAVPISDNTFLTVTLEQPDIFLTDKSGHSETLITLPTELLGAWSYQDGIVTYLEKDRDWFLTQIQVDSRNIIKHQKLPELSLLDLQTIAFDGESLIYVERITENSEVIVAKLN